MWLCGFVCDVCVIVGVLDWDNCCMLACVVGVCDCVFWGFIVVLMVVVLLSCCVCVICLWVLLF